MRSWALWTNNSKAYRTGSIQCIDQPWWLALLEWFCDTVIGWVCCSSHNPIARIPLPNWPKRQWKYCDEGETYTPREWHGDVGAIFSQHLYSPLATWIARRQTKYSINVEIGYDKIRELFEASCPGQFRYDD